MLLKHRYKYLDTFDLIRRQGTSRAFPSLQNVFQQPWLYFIHLDMIEEQLFTNRSLCNEMKLFCNLGIAHLNRPFTNVIDFTFFVFGVFVLRCLLWVQHVHLKSLGICFSTSEFILQRDKFIGNTQGFT